MYTKSKVNVPSTLKIYQILKIWYACIPTDQTGIKLPLNLNSLDVSKGITSITQTAQMLRDGVIQRCTTCGLQ